MYIMYVFTSIKFELRLNNIIVIVLTTYLTYLSTKSKNKNFIERRFRSYVIVMLIYTLGKIFHTESS